MFYVCACVNYVSSGNWWLACTWFGTVGIADRSRGVVAYFGDEEDYQQTISTFGELSLFSEQEALRFVRTIDVVLHFRLPRDDTSGCYPSPLTAIVFWLTTAFPHCIPHTCPKSFPCNPPSLLHRHHCMVENKACRWVQIPDPPSTYWISLSK